MLILKKNLKLELFNFVFYFSKIQQTSFIQTTTVIALLNKKLIIN